MSDMETARLVMVRDQLRARGMRDANVLRAMSQVPRERFVPAELRDQAYADRPLPIASGQTISQPYIVGYMLEALALEPGDRVLEVGAGSGYAAAVIAEIAAQVFAVERLAELVDAAVRVLREAGCDNVHIRQGDGSLGWPEQAPFDAILVSAGGPAVPAALKQQLKTGGRLVIPVGSDPSVQQLLRITRTSDEHFDQEALADVRFVPLIGAQGWKSGEPGTRPKQ